MAGYGDNPGFDSYVAAAGYVYPDGVTEPQKAAARQRGALFIDRYEPKFPGTRTGGYQQERAWPRTGAATYCGKVIPSDVIPTATVNACYEAAYLELTYPGSLSPVVTGSSAVNARKLGSLRSNIQPPLQRTLTTSSLSPPRSSLRSRGCCGRS